MNTKKVIGILLFITLIIPKVNGQTGFKYYFPDLNGWGFSTGYTGSVMANELKVDASAIGGSYQSFTYAFPVQALSNYPYIQVKIRTASAVRVRIDFADANYSTNTSPITYNIPGTNTYLNYTFDLSNKFSQTYPSVHPVQADSIVKLIFYINPGGASPFYTGSVYFDSLKVGSSCKIPTMPKAIKLNQIGFYQKGTKIAIAAEAIQDSFYIVSATKKDTLYRGKLGLSAKWPYSNENSRKADFSVFNKTGSFFLAVDSSYSNPFLIAPKINLNLSKGLLKSFYFNRASSAIVAPWGGKWTRAAGHPDTLIYVYSATASNYKEGHTFSSPKGWYDAGDYNKYVVNAGITTYTLLALYEHFPSYCDTLNTFIPESQNKIPDVLDEVLWELRWLFTTQDPNDGGVYHKISSLHFDGTEMPAYDNLARYGIFKGTAASLNFSAVMAQASRIFSKFNAVLPGLSDSCLAASKKAYLWAKANPNAIYTANPAGVSTGGYTENQMGDEFSWARMELYATTRNDLFYSQSDISGSFYAPSYTNVAPLGLITLINYRRQLNTIGYRDTATMKSQLLALADGYVGAFKSSAYGVVAGQNAGDFSWGSNSNIGNQAFILIQAFRLTKDSSYFKAALSNLDYLLGRNGPGYSFVTGFGTKSPMNPHHRISSADGVADPIPGMVVGGANPGTADPCTGYPTGQAGMIYLDAQCSFSTNEPAINYTAPLTYVAGAFEGLYAGADFYPAYTTPPPPGSAGLNTIEAGSLVFTIFPNPNEGAFTIDLKELDALKLSVTDVSGHLVLTESASGKNSGENKIQIAGLSQGFYFVSVQTKDSNYTKKLVVK
jgi:endoglucanase